MIIKRPSAPFKVVCLEDPALDDLPFKMLEEYSYSRDFDRLDLSKCVEKPTVFHCYPLKPRYEHLTVDVDPGKLWGIFSRHVFRVDDAGFEVATETVHDEPRIKNTMRDCFTPEDVAEVASAIMQAANKDGASLPFFSPGSWQVTRVRRMSLRAITASSETATKTSSK